MSAESERGYKTSSLAMKDVEAGYELLRAGSFAEALEHAERLLARAPDDIVALDYASEAALVNDDPARALVWIDRAVQLSGSPAFTLKKARLLLQMRRRGEACQAAAEAAKSPVQDPNLLWQVASLHSAGHRFAEAIEYYEAVRKRVGDHPPLLYDLAVARFFSGQMNAAEIDLDRLLQRAPQVGHAWYLRSTLRRQTAERNHVAELRQCLSRGLPNANAESAVLYALSKELEDLGDEEQSMSVLLEAAQKRRSASEYNIDNECRAMDDIRRVYTRDVMEQPTQGHTEAGAIFIVGMPRTGTTLVERFFVQSQAAKSAGELLDFANLLASSVRRYATQGHVGQDPERPAVEVSTNIDFEALGRDYMRGARESAEGSPIFIDKMPVNFMYCGLIRKALPQARIVHVVRDPLDTCHAILKTLFFEAYPFSYDQRELALYYIAYHRMMQHWHQVMPGQILDVQYEDLVRDPETQARRIYDWCGLRWSPDALSTPTESTAYATASAAQVREPVHQRSLNRSRQHRAALATLVEMLESAGIPVP